MVDELYHYGVQGQKWGLRRYQNSDGTYTSLGARLKNIRWGSGGKGKTSGAQKQESKSTAKKQSFSIFKKKSSKKVDEDANLSTEEKKAKYAKNAKTLFEHRDMYSDVELNAAYNRLNLEKRIQDMIPKEKSNLDKVSGYVKTITEGLTMTSNMIEAGTKIYKAIDSATKATSGKKSDDDSDDSSTTNNTTNTNISFISVGGGKKKKK